MSAQHVGDFKLAFEEVALDAALESNLPSSVMAQLSAAISLKRIADALWGNEMPDGGTTGIIQLLNGIEQNGRRF